VKSEEVERHADIFFLGSGLQGVHPMTEVAGGLARTDEFSGE